MTWIGRGVLPKVVRSVDKIVQNPATARCKPELSLGSFLRMIIALLPHSPTVAPKKPLYKCKEFGGELIDVQTPNVQATSSQVLNGMAQQEKVVRRGKDLKQKITHESPEIDTTEESWPPGCRFQDHPIHPEVPWILQKPPRSRSFGAEHSHQKNPKHEEVDMSSILAVHPNVRWTLATRHQGGFWNRFRPSQPSGCHWGPKSQATAECSSSSSCAGQSLLADRCHHRVASIDLPRVPQMESLQGRELHAPRRLRGWGGG